MSFSNFEQRLWFLSDRKFRFDGRACKLFLTVSPGDSIFSFPLARADYDVLNKVTGCTKFLESFCSGSHSLATKLSHSMLSADLTFLSAALCTDGGDLNIDEASQETSTA